MKRVVFGLMLLAFCRPADAQIGDFLHKLDQASQKVDEITVSQDEEIAIGRDVSEKLRQRFGVVQDPAVTKYVALVGTLLARQSDRPDLPWTFVVLDTDGVNAFAAPGGIVHITRGALGLIQNEAELAAVLGHEITHVAHKHAVDAIRKNKVVQLAADRSLADRQPLLDRFAKMTYDMILENAFDRHDELDADGGSVDLTAKLGYAPGALADFLQRLDDRNRDMPTRNGLFASHPETSERVEKVRALAGTRTGAVVEARYKSQISYQPTPVTEIATVVEGAAGLTGSTQSGGDKKDKNAEPEKKEKKKKGFGLGRLTAAVRPSSESAQVSASGGARGVGPDRLAKGGPDPALVTVQITADELATFRRGIAG